MTNRRIPTAVLLTTTCLLPLAGVTATDFLGSARAQAPDAKAGAPGAATAEGVMRRTTEIYKKAKSIAVELNRSQKAGAVTMQVTSSVAFQRPNKLAFVTKGTAPGIDLVSDGKTLFIAIPTLKKYTEGEAPESIEALMSDPIGACGAAAFDDRRAVLR